ncbi:MAG TPA: energy-coupling factor transporter transmembrane component T [Paludibaculum sp.]
MAQRIGPGIFVFDQWSRGNSAIHRLDPRLKVIACFLLLILTSLWSTAWCVFPIAVLIAAAARIPLLGLARRAALVLPFTLIFAAVTALIGDYPRAAALLWRSYLSALWVSLLMATTPLEAVLETAARFGVPRLLVEVTHFTWRYLGVIGAQAWRLKTAALTRGGERSFDISAASLAVLFASSYARAERIHRAMLSRGATGENA